MDKRRGRKPGSWKTGPNPLVHEKYKAYELNRVQATFRGESWQFTFDTWCAVWGVNWSQRGRASTDLCMTRINMSGAWSPDNVMLIERGNHTRRHIATGTRRTRRES